MAQIQIAGQKYVSAIEFAIQVLGGKWKMPIIWALKTGPKRYGDLKRRVSPITHKMLSKQLKELQEFNLINREVFEVVPPKVEYSLTAAGKTVIPVIEHFRVWGLSYTRTHAKP